MAGRSGGLAVHRNPCSCSARRSTRHAPAKDHLRRNALRRRPDRHLGLLQRLPLQPLEGNVGRSVGRWRQAVRPWTEVRLQDLWQARRWPAAAFRSRKDGPGMGDPDYNKYSQRIEYDPARYRRHQETCLDSVHVGPAIRVGPWQDWPSGAVLSTAGAENDCPAQLGSPASFPAVVPTSGRGTTTRMAGCTSRQPLGASETREWIKAKNPKSPATNLAKDARFHNGWTRKARRAVF